LTPSVVVIVGIVQFLRICRGRDVITR